MRLAPEQVLLDIQREDPRSWCLMEGMLEHLPALSREADYAGDIPDRLWHLVPAELQNRINMPVEYGGLAITATAIRRAVVFERIGRICAGLPIGLPGPGLSMPPVLSLGTARQKRDYFGRFLERQQPTWGAFAITEPHAGSDATAVRTVARRCGDRYVLEGSKCFITSGRRADVVVVFATLDPSKGRFGIRGFVVPKGTPGFSVDRCEDMLGLRASQLASLSFSQCELPAEAMLGHDGKRGPLVDAFSGAQHAWDYMRPVLSALINGSMLGIVETVASGLETGELELTASQRAAACEELELFRARIWASQLLALRAAWRFDRAESCSRDASIAKAFASALAMDLAHRMVALFPIQAAMRGHPIEKFYRDAKAFDILEGTGDMQRLMIARAQPAASQKEVT